MIRYRSLPVLAIRRMLGNWKLLSSVVAGTLIAAAILAATSIYADAIRDLGLQHAIESEPEPSLDVSVVQTNTAISAQSYESMLQRHDAAVSRALGPAMGEPVRNGQSATFFPTTPGEPVDDDDSSRPRANLFFRSGMEQHLEMVDGEFPGAQEAGAETIEAVLGNETAERLGISVGDTFELHPFWEDGAEPITVVVAGTARVSDPDARYWGRHEELLEARERSWETLRFAVPPETLLDAVNDALPTLSAEFETTYLAHLEALDARNAESVASGLRGLPSALATTEASANVHTQLESVLRGYDERLFFTRIPLFVLLLQIGGIVAYYLVMVSTMLVERQAAEIATLRSRGATTGQLLAQYAVEGGILAALATFLGPPIAAAVISALGPTPAFSALSGGGPLEVHISGVAYALAAGGALIAFLALMLPAWRATRSTVVEFKRSSARPQPTPFFLRFYLDVVLVVVVALVFWRLSREDDLVSETLFGDAQVDPFLLATPAVFMVTVGIVFLRLFPLALLAIAWVVEQTRSVAVLVGMRSVVRDPTHYTRLILLLMFATGVGMFGATFSATLDRSYEDRASYVSGGDVRFSDARGDLTPGDEAFVSALAGLDAEHATPLVRQGGTAQTGNQRAEVTVLGIEPESFEQVAHMRDDFIDAPYTDMLSGLRENSTFYEGIALPDDTLQIGVWLRFPDIRGRVATGYVARDASGRFVQHLVANGVPDDEAAGEWRFFPADLEQPAGRTGGRARGAAVNLPLEIHGIYFSPQGGVARQQGAIEIGPMYATSEAAPDGGHGSPFEEMPWADAEQVTAFPGDAFQLARGVDLTPPEDEFRSTSNAPPGLDGAMRYEWQDAGRGPFMRGISVRTDGELARVYVSNDALAALNREPGDHLVLTIGGRYIQAEIAGGLDYFPTFEANGQRGLVVGDASRLIAEANAALPDQSIEYNEAWLRTGDPAATVTSLEPLEPRNIVVRSDVLAEQQEDPLIAAGWAGILAIAFGAVLLLSAIGFVVYSYLTAQQRGLEFAILRTLGLSRPQVFSVVLFEHLLIIVAGMGLGTIVGLRVGELMMGFLATDEAGESVLPPFVMQVSWTEVALVWAILGTVFVITIAAVVALYLRLAVHRVLRIGDV